MIRTGLRINPKKITVKADGDTKKFTSTAPRVEDALKEADVQLDRDDEVSRGRSALVSEGDTLDVTRIEMIDKIQGPPRWDGPDLLLRQTSFRALSEPRLFREPDGSVADGALRVRFGEVEARGIALTPAGRDLYDRAVAEADRR